MVIKKPKKPRSAIREGGKGRIFKRGKAEFILPEREIKQLAKQGKFSDPLEFSEAEIKERRQAEIQNIAQKGIDIETAKKDIKGKITPQQGLLDSQPTEEIKTGVDDRNFLEKALDVVSAPISQPGTFFTKGPVAGGEAVAESREGIVAGEESGAQAIVGIVGNTLLAAGALLLGTGGALALTGKLVGAKIAATTGLVVIYAVDKFLLSPGELGTWAAVDNVGSALSFQSKAVADGVVFQGGNPAEANTLFDEMQTTIETMRQYVEGEVSRNPKLWASRKPLLKALEVSSQGIEIQRQRLEIT